MRFKTVRCLFAFILAAGMLACPTLAVSSLSVSLYSYDDASAFYNTIWEMRSYTGVFEVILNSNGTYSAESYSGMVYDTGEWFYRNNSLILGGNQYIQKTSGNEVWFVAETSGGNIGLYPIPVPNAISVVTNIGEVANWGSHATPYIGQSGEIMVPIYPMGELFQANVSWDSSQQKATFTGTGYFQFDLLEYEKTHGTMSSFPVPGLPCDTVIEFIIGSATAKITYKSESPSSQVSRKTISLAEAPTIANNCIYVPLQPLANAFGCSLDWSMYKSQNQIKLLPGHILHPFEGIGSTQSINSTLSFSDRSAIDYQEAVAAVSNEKIVTGYSDGTFRPDAVLTRGAAAKIICNMTMGAETAKTLNDVIVGVKFSDVQKGSTFIGYIGYCTSEGIVSGYSDGTFRPGANLSGYAFMKMLLVYLGYDAKQEGYVGANWGQAVAKRALSLGLTDGLAGSFNGLKPVTRQEACLYAFNAMKLK